MSQLRAHEYQLLWMGRITVEHANLNWTCPGRDSKLKQCSKDPRMSIVGLIVEGQTTVQLTLQPMHSVTDALSGGHLMDKKFLNETATLSSRVVQHKTE
jgi:hypothetical protein